MRIPNHHKTAFQQVIIDSGLELKHFIFKGGNEKYNIKYKFDYFEFDIILVTGNKYDVSVRYIDDLNPHHYTKYWADLISILTVWAKQIAKDIEHAPSQIQPHEEIFPTIINKHCKKFIEIYNQALTAETNGLTEICGLGYRKSFEFLIKDYLLKKHPKQEHEKIKNYPINQCISDYVTSDEIKLLSHRVLWLGNDQAHYIKIWKQKSYTDLKQLIKLTIKWIENKEELLKIEKSMPNRKNKKNEN